MDWTPNQDDSKRTQLLAGSVVTQVAERIREDVFQLADGAFLGSEEDLILRYNVSRPTLRQAAGLIIQEQLLVARRSEERRCRERV